MKTIAYYADLVEEYTLYGKLQYQSLNDTQKNLFLRVLHGLEVYSEEELIKMSPAKKRRIKSVYIRGQKEISLVKHEIVFRMSNEVFNIFFNSSIAQYIAKAPVEVIEEDEEIRKIPFRKLGIDYDFLIVFFMKKGLLPKNFSSL